MDTVVIPANRIERAANIMARRYRGGALVMVAGSGVMGVVAVVSLITGAAGGSLAAFAVFAMFAGAFAFALRRSARRAAWIGERAAADPSLMWLVEDYRLIALDEVGTPLPELALKISPALRHELTEMPRALLR
jgi:hypothetical protein